ncbi:MAG TPA: cation:proton antiporter [Verrucomicrobiota bacterium]|nr:sodium:proton exchanger [Verrucomicrobiales bacterium]HRI11808.1 cation:proton antiporter [Verrucomicrobiota bacterium]
MTLLVLFVLLLFLYSLASRRLERTVITTPIVFTAAGMLTQVISFDLGQGLESREAFLVTAELGLVLLLFTDASRTQLGVLKNIRNLPVRLLSVGMLLTLLLGLLLARGVFPNLTWWEAGILAAILAPTDAGLGQIIVASEVVPMKIRQALNVEAGLNDGLSVPFLLFFMALASQANNSEHGHGGLFQFIGEQLGLGALLGIGIGWVGGWMLEHARRRGWIATSWLQLGVVALPLLCLLASKAVDASMFIAAFVAGLAVQARFPEAAKHSVEFTEQWGQLFNLAVFYLFGILVMAAAAAFTGRHLLYAILSLTVIRMVPVAVSLVGTRLSPATVLFMGWFGPRGLASIVLGLVFLEEETRVTGESTIRLAVMLTVWISIFAHGMSAVSGIGWYVRKLKKLPSDAPELAKKFPSAFESKTRGQET